MRNQLSRFTFRNIVINAILVGDFQWAENFIGSYQHYLEPRYRESTVSPNLAQLAYRRKNYGRALELLQKSEYSDLLLNLSAKAMLIKIFYDIGEAEGHPTYTGDSRKRLAPTHAGIRSFVAH